jgi:hypothetical protein
MNISSRQLKAFVLTARHQSFSRAAEQLFITQSGMSVLVRELEAQLGFRLFDRTTRKVTLTEFGTKFLPIADRSLLELEAAASIIGRAASTANRQLVIGATPIIASRLLPAVIGDYVSRTPELKIVLRDGERSRNELKATLESLRLSTENPRGFGLYFDCVSRGSGLYNIPDHDAAYIGQYFSQLPVAGFFTGFEIGPLGNGTGLLQYSGVLALVSERAK